jgi:hypothetical protein
MASSYHVFQACTPFLTTGTAGALEALGISAEPGSIEIIFHEEDRKSDGAGRAPADIQAMGQEAVIDLVLGSRDDAVMAKAMQRSQGAAGNTTEGLGAAPGVLLGSAGLTFGLYLPSSTDLPWYFPTCKISAPRWQPGTKSDDLRVRFRAWRFVSGIMTSSSAVELYRRSAPA